MSALLPPPPDISSLAGAHDVPLYFRTCPVVAPVVLTSVNAPSVVAPPPLNKLFTSVKSPTSVVPI